MVQIWTVSFIPKLGPARITTLVNIPGIMHPKSLVELFPNPFRTNTLDCENYLKTAQKSIKRAVSCSQRKKKTGFSSSQWAFISSFFSRENVEENAMGWFSFWFPRKKHGVVKISLTFLLSGLGFWVCFRVFPGKLVCRFFFWQLKLTVNFDKLWEGLRISFGAKYFLFGEFVFLFFQKYFFSYYNSQTNQVTRVWTRFRSSRAHSISIFYRDKPRSNIFVKLI